MTNHQEYLNTLPDFFSIEALSKVLGVSKATVYRMAGQQKIPCMRIGKRIILSRSHVQRWIEQKMEVC